MFHISKTDTFKLIYFASFHSITKFDFLGGGGNSSDSKMLFTEQKKIIRNVGGAKPRNLCRSLFKRLEMLFLPHQ
jgi:hypothetical protein